MSKIKAAVITYSLSGGGAEKNILLLRAFMESAGVTMDIIRFKDINDYAGEFPDRRNDISLTGFRGKIPPVLFPFAAVSAAIRLVRYTRKNNYSVFVGLPNNLPFYTAVFLSLLQHKKCVLVVVNNIRTELKRLPVLSRVIHSFLIRRSFMLCDSVICKSYGTSLMLQKEFRIKKDRIRIIPNGLDLSDIKVRMREKLQPPYNLLFKKNDIILSAGRLTEQKNYHGLLSLFHELKLIKRQKPLKLCIFGQGKQLESLKNHAIMLGLGQEVLFPGFESRNIYKYMAQAKLFILPSLYEGFGTVLIEALACGCPTISTDCNYGPREILAGSTNYSAKPAQKLTFGEFGMLMPVAFAEKNLCKKIARSLSIFLLDKDRLSVYKKKSRERAREYSLQNVGDSYAELIRQLAQEGYDTRQASAPGKTPLPV